PFVPDETATLDQTCFEVAHIQLTALARRLESIGPNAKVVIGISGGLDSTNALLAAAGTMHRLGRPMTDILAFTMPGFATSEGTKSNAWRLMKAVGVTAEEIDIRPAATQMMKDLGHPEDQYDVTFENIQAGLRADYLFRAANQRGGLVLGTGDLSEAALGWCTYGVGDHISHYNVNAGLPKTLMQYVIRWYIDQHMIPDADDVLRDILAQEISPELVPAKDGEPLQSTQSAVGPYPLNDFFLAHMLAGEAPSRLAYLAWHAWRDVDAGAWPSGTPDDQHVAYDLATIKAWLAKFYGRFFASQFKRSASPDGPQVLPVSLSPRGGWAMPSDAKPDAWLAELANIPDTI
ncbi:MAG: NAD(+) synthase, partial [Propionibacteriaceae bacterium]|nr:NAD(+) synthase [Propionibacteriaceae bacterium]